MAETTTKTAVFAGGCFWCLQPPYDKAEGVIKTEVGYSGGKAETATYEQVSEGDTGHREVIRITYNPDTISYEKLLEIFWDNIDAADEYGQYADRGFQYTTAIYVTDDAERKIAESSKAAQQKKLPKPISTVIEPASAFYPAEDYHQQYYKKNALRYTLYKNASGRK